MTGRGLSDTLTYLRQQARLTQDKLADSAGVARGTVKGIEGGRPTAQPRTLRKLAEALATDGFGRHDEGRADDLYQQLMLAAGHLDAPPEAVAVSIGLRGELEQIFRRADDAEILAEIAVDLAQDDPDHRAQILVALRTLVRRHRSPDRQ